MKKYFIMNQYFKKYLPIFLISIFVIILMSTSYALLRNGEVGADQYVMNVGLLRITFEDSKTNSLNLSNMVPMSDKDGLEQTEELTFTIKNTGTLFADYNIFIEETSADIKMDSVIRYAVNKNDTGYGTPQTLSDNEYLDKIGSLDINETATYKVKLWIDEDADSTYMNKTFTARVVIEAIQDTNPVSTYIENSIKSSTCNPAIEENGVTYLSGEDDCIDFNYVWYSGKLWRIVSLNSDGIVKMITQDLITIISYGEDYNFYQDENTNSYVYQWLNQDFLDTLYNYNEIIETDYSWNVTSGDGIVSTKLEETTLVTAPVGLLNSYEYYKSYEKLGNFDDGYLNIGFYWWLSNRYSSSSSNVWHVYNLGDPLNDKVYRSYGVRPVINLKSTTQISSGTGTREDPYILKRDKNEAIPNTTLLNTRTSGEYVNFDNEKYRIVNVENDGSIKLNKVDYISDENGTYLTKYYASTHKYLSAENEQSDEYWDYYLNNVWYKNISSSYKNMMQKGTYYLGFAYLSYKEGICETPSNSVSTKNCKKTSQTWTGYVGLPSYGEMFASQLSDGYRNADEMWLITPNVSPYVWRFSNSGEAWSNEYNSSLRNARPTIHLLPSIKIVSGSGTEEIPFEISL